MSNIRDKFIISRKGKIFMEENLNVEQQENVVQKEKFYKKKGFWIIVILLIIGCFIWWMSQPVKTGSNSSKNNSNQNKSEVVGDRSNEYIDEKKIDNIYTSTAKYKGMNIKITGQVFNIISSDSDGVQFQIHRDVENNDQNTLIYYPKTDKTIKEDDFVSIDGYIYDDYTYTNAYGGTLSAPCIVAYTVKKKQYKDVVRPTLKEVELNKSIKKYGVNIIIDKVEFAEKETRIYVTIENNSGYEFNLYKYSAKIVQNSSQYEYESNYDADYAEIQTEILSGVTTSGVLTFPAISQDSFKLILSCSSDNYSWHLRDFTFDIEVK